MWHARDLPHAVKVVADSELFDAAWYLARYRDAGIMNMDAAEHYIRLGARLQRDPGPNFSTAFYLITYVDVAQAGVNPLWHYIAHGRAEGRRVAPCHYYLQPRAPKHPVPLLVGAPPADRPARVICFYLPQFHPIAENDEWWGEGFTEWSNVTPALPTFPRHYQPHKPGELGYYDLRDTSVQRRQIELAKIYGIEGFCFYFYWFAGKRLLETPLQNYLSEPALDLPFCLCWANENWSRRWDGRDDDILIAQEHTPEDDLAFIAHVADYMRDPRYIRIDGKPLLVVYRPGLLPDPSETASRWRQWCRKNGLGEIFLAYTQSFESDDPGEYGFDAAIEFPPNNSGVPRVTEHCRPYVGFQGKMYDWSALIERSYSYRSTPYKLFRGLCPSWDNTARRGSNGTILVNSNPRQFTRWASNAIRDTKARFKPADERIVFVNAWNEWAEGAHLEPDQRHGYAWLESVRVALACNADPEPLFADEARIAVVVDAQHADSIQEIIDLICLLDERHKLFINTISAHADAVRTILDASGRHYSLKILPEHGRGAISLLDLYPTLRAEGFGLIIKIQTGEPIATPGEALARPLYVELLGKDCIERALALFDADPRLGMLCPDTERVPIPIPISSSVLLVGARLGLSDEEIAGQAEWQCKTFIARTTALKPLTSLAFSDATFKPGTSEFDASLVPAIERSIALSAIASGLRVGSTNQYPSAGRRPRLVIVSHDAHPHGAQFLAMNMARSFGELGFDVDMIVLGPGPLLDRFREVATVHCVDPDETPSRVLGLLAGIRAKGAEIAIANTTVSGLLVPLLKQAGFCTVSLIHELPGVLNGYKLEAHARAIADHADQVIFPAQIVQHGFEQFIGQPIQQAQIRPQGLYLRNPHRTQTDRARVRMEMRTRLGLASDARIILCVAYGDHRKGLDLFVDACIKTMARDPNAVAVWVGHHDPSLYALALSTIGDSGLEDRFVFPGLVLDHIHDFYTAANVYAMTSREDPFPSVVMDALDAYIPVVAFSGVGGFEELLVRGCGVLVPAFETDKMADAFVKLLDDSALAEKLATRGHDIIKSEFSFSHYLYDLAELAGQPIPKVSVVVPNYNYARYIAERLSSIQCQTAPIYELIVLDDASSDNSVEIIQRFLADCDIPSRLVVNPTNSGSVFKQWRRGVDMARGDLVWIAEADDLADPEFLEQLLPALRQQDLVLSYAQSRQMGSDGEILCEHYLDYVADIDRERWTQPYVADGQEEIAKALFLKNTIPNVSGAVFRRDALLEVLIEHEDEINSYRNAGDWVVYLRLLEKGGIAYCPRSLNSHRRHQSSITIANFNIEQLSEILRVQRDTIRRFSLGSDAALRADAYSQQLYVQFGLASPECPIACLHPELRA